MKLKGKLIAGLMLVTLFTMQGFKLQAQPGEGRGSRGMHGRGPDSCHIQLMIDDLSKELSLTDQQKQKITDIHYTHMAEVKKVDAQYQNDCVGERDARIKLREKMDADVKAVLNDDQKIKYNEFMSNRRGPHGKSHDGKGGCSGQEKP